MIFKSLQRLSVFLVLILSISRTIVLVIPLHHVAKRTVLSSILGYLVYLVLENIILEREETIIYDRVDVYCYEQDNPRLVSVLNDCLHVATLALPLIPIVISCVVSVHHVRNSTHLSAHSDVAGSVMKRRATVTVILLTLTYLFFNIPLIANLVVWIVTVSHYGGWPGPVYSTNTFFYMYCWNVTDVLFVGLNAAFNPIIYFLRFPNCQRWTISNLTGFHARLTGRRQEATSVRRCSSFRARNGSVILSHNYSTPYSDVKTRKITELSPINIPLSDIPSIVNNDEVDVSICDVNIKRHRVGNELETVSNDHESMDVTSVYSNRSANEAISSARPRELDV